MLALSAPRWYRGAKRWIQFAALVFSVPSSIVSAGLLAKPKVSIVLGPQVSQSPLDYLFLIKNEGLLPTFVEGFGCGETTNAGGGGSASFDDGLWLDPGQTTTRTCGRSSLGDLPGSRLGVSIEYQSYLIPHQFQRYVSFMVVQTANGYILVPEAAKMVFSQIGKTPH